MPGGCVRWYIAGAGGCSWWSGAEIASDAAILDEFGFAAEIGFFDGKGALFLTVFKGEFTLSVSTGATRFTCLGTAAYERVLLTKNFNFFWIVEKSTPPFLIVIDETFLGVLTLT